MYFRDFNPSNVASIADFANGSWGPATSSPRRGIGPAVSPSHDPQNHKWLMGKNRVMKKLSEARAAIVFEWFERSGGGGYERVVPDTRKVLPNADFFALVHDPGSLKGTPLERIPVRTSFIQSLPKGKERYRAYLPLMLQALSTPRYARRTRWSVCSRR